MTTDAICRLCIEYAEEYLEGSSPVQFDFLPKLGQGFKKRVESIAAQVIGSAEELSSSQLPFALYGAVVELRKNAEKEAERIIESLGDEIAGRVSAHRDEFSGRSTPVSTLTQFMSENFPDYPVVLAALKYNKLIITKIMR